MKCMTYLSYIILITKFLQDEFPDCPPMFKQAVSLARYLLDPLVEVCHLFNSNDDILFIHFHPLQNEVRKEDLLFTLQLECINRVNEVGITNITSVYNK